MRNLILTILFITVAFPLSAQRFGYVDTDYILKNLPQYNQALSTLENQTKQWNQEILKRQEDLEKRRANFLNEKVLLTDDQIKKEEAEIEAEANEIRELQEKRYGQDGDLIRMRRSIVKPIQDQVWIAVKQVAERRNYGFVFDKGSDLIMIYTDPKFDISRDVLNILNPNAVGGKSEASSSSNTSRGNTNANTNRSNTNRRTAPATQNKGKAEASSNQRIKR